MSFPINVNIPDAPNDPADDQPRMKANYANISGFLSVDHVAPGTTGDGFHKVVTFNSNNVPAFPLTKGVLFTNNAPTIPQLFYYTGNAAQSSSQYTQSATGSTMLLGGIILKWGKEAIPSGTHATGTITFANAFPNNCFAVLQTFVIDLDTSTTSNNTIAVVDASVNVSSFKWVSNNNTSGKLKFFYWAAIGN